MFRPFATSSRYVAEYYNTDLWRILAIYSFVIFISAAHSFFVSQWKNSKFLVRPELLVNDILRRVALGTRMALPSRD